MTLPIRVPGGPAVTAAALAYCCVVAIGFPRERATIGVPSVLSRGLDSLDAALQHAGDPSALREARRHYKHLEALLEYYAPPLVTALNSNETEPVDDDQRSGFKTPRGFQAIEGGGSSELRAMRTAIARFRPNVPFIAPTDTTIAELARLELARVSTLGVAGFDASRDAITESADALEGVVTLLAQIRPSPRAAIQSVAAAAVYARAHADFDSFDRFAFVRDYANPAFSAIASLHLTDTTRLLRRTWPDSVASVYSAHAFNASSYSLPNPEPLTRAAVTRGRNLFFDTTLSANHKRSCASCHDPDRAFTDGLAITVKRNTPTLINAALQPAQFADARRATLEDQIRDVLANPAEMGSTDTSRAVREALAAYVRSLTSFNSRFDRAIRGESELTSDERRGFNLFMGKAGCGTCHFAPLFGGALPPMFVVSDAEVIGVPRSASGRAEIDPDLGRGAIDKRDGLAHAFKTPSVRNSAVTAPYMHNGVFRTLDDVIDFYDRGGGRGLGIDVQNQTLSARALHLTTQERQALVAFLQALTDTTTHTSPH